MSTIAIVGAGPQLGLAIARAFGAHGFSAALISRNQTRLDDLVATLESEGVTAAGFAADVRDRPGLTRALVAAAERLGRVDVLEYSPLSAADRATLTTPAQSTPDDIQGQVEFQLFGAMAATAAVLPAMREAGAGSLLFTTGGGSIDPSPMVGNVNAAGAILRNWTLNLHKELADTGVYAAHVAIAVSIETQEIPGTRVSPAADIAAAYWALHTQRRDSELVFTG